MKILDLFLLEYFITEADGEFQVSYFTVGHF